MNTLLITIAARVLAALYAPLKLLPTNPNKVVFLSRQSSEPSLDFRMLGTELRCQNPDARIVCICNRIKPGPASAASFALDTLRSLCHLATARVCVLDSYWPAVSLLSHKPQLVVSQMWHSLGKVKKSGLQAAGKPGGRNRETARALRMHANYDYVVAGAPAWNRFYCEGLGCRPEQIWNVGLPRLDPLAAGQPKTAGAILARYPQLAARHIVLYAPTFRRSDPARAAAAEAALAQALHLPDVALVVKTHPNQPFDAPGALTCPEFSAMELLSVANVLVTDYSSIAIEAAAANVPTLYYLYDHDEYQRSTGTNIDLAREMPGCVFRTAADVARAARRACTGDYPFHELTRYRTRFVLADPGHSTVDLAAAINRLLAPAPARAASTSQRIVEVSFGCPGPATCTPAAGDAQSVAPAVPAMPEPQPIERDRTQGAAA